MPCVTQLYKIAQNFSIMLRTTFAWKHVQGEGPFATSSRAACTVYPFLDNMVTSSALNGRFLTLIRRAANFSGSFFLGTYTE